MFTDDRSIVSGSSLTSPGKALRKATSEPFLTRKVRIDESSISHASSSPSSNARHMNLAGLPKSRSGALNLPQVPGGMRHDDDALQGLLTAAKARLKRGYIKPFDDGNTVEGIADATLLESPMAQLQQDISLQQAQRKQQAVPLQASSAQQMMQPGWDEWDAIGATMSDNPFDGPPNRGMYGDTQRGGSVPTTTGSVHTIERLDAYTSTNTALSGHVCAEDALGFVQKMWNHEGEALNLDDDFFQELTGGMGGGPDSAAGRADSNYSSQEGYSTDEAGGSTDEPLSPTSQISREVSAPSDATPFQSQRLTESVPWKQPKEIRTPLRQDSAEPSGSLGGVSGAATAASNTEPLRGSLSHQVPAAESDPGSSNALANRRRREGAPTTAEVARESRRRRWMNAYDEGGQHGSRGSHGFAMGASGYTAANSSAQTTSGTSVSRRS